MKRTVRILLVALCLSVAIGGIALAQAPARLDHGVVGLEAGGGPPRLGIVSAFGAEADILLANTQHRREHVINGNTFTTGTLNGNRVVIVLTGVSVVNAAMITQLMLDHFRIDHLLMSGIAGGVDPANHIGDVVIPEKWAFPLENYWNGDSDVPTPCGSLGDLSCLGLRLSTFTNTPGSDYQVPSAGGPVGTGLFMRDTFVRTNDNFPDGEFVFDYAVDSEMFEVAQDIDPALAQCGPLNPSLCVSVQPEIRRGGRGLTAGFFLANPDYRAYVSEVLEGQSFDMETTAFAHVAYANGVPFIAFRSLSDLAGGDDSNDVRARVRARLRRLRRELPRRDLRAGRRPARPGLGPGRHVRLRLPGGVLLPAGSALAGRPAVRRRVLLGRRQRRRDERRRGRRLRRRVVPSCLLGG
jgi:adenosylhomocysteine nucleosidase